ncbi:apolipoprotein N-acyltransferase [Desulfovibrio aminophilus]|nr:apolipoprotein N-acyltransferase [Desulfovibrio aminophilus]
MPVFIILCALGAWSGFANPYFQFPPTALLLPLGLAGVGMLAETPRRALKMGWLAGTLAATGCLYWIYIPVQHYGNLPWYLALPCPALLASALGVYYGLFALCMQRAARRLSGFSTVLAAGVLWAGMEWCVGHLLTGFPWLTLSAAFTPWPWAVQGAAFIGAYGLSGILAAVGVGLVLTPSSRAALVLALLLAGGVPLYGWHALEQAAPGGAPVTVGLIQGDIDQSLKWDPEYQAATVERYTGLSSTAITGAKPDLLVWPETALPFYFQEPSPLRDRVAAFAREHKTPILAGAPAYTPATPPAKPELFNRAYLLAPSGEVAGFYDKEHLVPFGEYVPLGQWLPLGKLVESVGDFSRGRNQRAPAVGNIALGVLVCYEGIFPELAQKRVEEGANLLVNISNDAWFGDSSAPWQHLQLSLLRAVEQGRWLARATNTGISLLADPQGRITARSGLFTEAALTGQARLETGATFFHQTFHIQTWALLGAAGFAVLTILFRPLKAAPRRKLLA